MIRILSILSSVFIWGCNSSPDKNVSKTAIYDLEKVNIGEVRIFADQNSKSLLEQLGAVYSAHFPKAFLSVEYRTDAEVMDAIYDDSVRLIVLMRTCSEGELSKLNRLYQAKPLQYTFAYDAISLVRDVTSTDTLIDSLQLDKWLSASEDIFVSTVEHAGIFQLLLRQNGVTDGTRSLKLVKDIDELQKFLKQHSNYIGVLPFSLVSDQYNPAVLEITSKFRWLGIKGKNGDEIYPSQSTIYTKEWPLVIPYTILYSKLSSEKGVGFVKFIHTRQASKLILKSGLIPVNMPERSIQVEDQSFELE